MLLPFNKVWASFVFFTPCAVVSLGKFKVTIIERILYAARTIL